MKVYVAITPRALDNIPGLTGIAIKDDSVLNITLNGTLMYRIPTVSYYWFLFERTPVYYNWNNDPEEEVI